MMINGRIDWDSTEKLAQRLTNEEIDERLKSLSEALPDADASDRENGSDTGGYFRDVISVLRREQADRRKIRLSFRNISTDDRGRVVLELQGRGGVEVYTLSPEAVEVIGDFIGRRESGQQEG